MIHVPKARPKFKLNNDAAVELIKAMFQALKEDYLEATRYMDEHPDEPPDSKQMKEMIALKKDCEKFTKTPLYYSVTDMDGNSLLNYFRRIG